MTPSEAAPLVAEREGAAVRDALQDDLAAIELSLAGVRAVYAPRLDAAARHSLLAGGKRLRPLLTCAVMRTLGRDPGPQRAVIAAVELIHCGSLLHDDVIDDAETRRGRPAAHLAFDPHTAILAGDLLLALALERLARCGCAALQVAAATALVEVCQGEVLEREQRFDPEVDLARARRVNHLKTAALFGYAAEAGALLSGASDAERDAARAFGRALGDAFQTVDDLLDWEGDAATVGKPVGRDLWGGLVTVPAALAGERDPAVRVMVGRVLQARRDGAASPLELPELAAHLERAGGFAAARELAAADGRAATEALGRLPAGPWRTWLETPVRRALERTC
ncbi:MAG: polyprenyl synthetase family protein [Deltaproteobacteria bacterium]|nr:polyprenyl synthetase family protein [Deltaproteobacteria bacterium]